MAHGGLKIGILGGTFNPPHIGHLIMAEYAVCEYGLSKVLFMPNGTPPHKDGTGISPLDRLEMTRLAIGGSPDFELCVIEVRSDEVSYTYATLEKLKKIYADDRLFFIVGADSAAEMGSWYHPERIFPNCEIIVADRISQRHPKINEEIEEVAESYGASIHRLGMPVIEFSSTDIRNRIKSGLPYKYMIPERVEEYIKSRNLYH